MIDATLDEIATTSFSCKCGTMYFSKSSRESFGGLNSRVFYTENVHAYSIYSHRQKAKLPLDEMG